MKLQSHTILAAVGLLLLSFCSVSADETSPAPPAPVQMKVTKAYAYTGNEVGLGDRLVIEVENLAQAIEQDKINPRDLVLFLDGRALKGVNASPIEHPGANKLVFELKRTEDSRPAWTALLGSPKQAVRRVSASVGFPDQQALPFSTAEEQKIALRVYNKGWAVIAAIGLVLVVILFVFLAKRGHLIRDSNPPAPPAGAKKPYSLAFTQAAFWFIVVIGSFLLIYLITGDYNTISDQALILMGIGTGTALGAAMIDSTKQDTSNTQLSGLRPEAAKLAAEVNELTQQQAALQQKLATPGIAPTAEDQAALRDTTVALQEKQAKLDETLRSIADAEAGLSKPVSENFGRDLLTDANGITLHRFQMVVWTIVLGVLFLIGVYKELAMPEFSATLLGLMGISSGTYLGFKIPERQN